jgi:peptidoglycan/LPS O-acetylase OafA/YrhL
MQFNWIHQISTCAPIPQNWSLGLEAAFYLLIPFLLILNVRGAAMLCSMAIFVLAYLGIFDPMYHGYRLLTGTLFMFLCGSYLFTRRNRMERIIPWAVCALAIAGITGTYLFPSYHVDYNRAVLAGVAIAVPAIYFLDFLRASKWDALAGHLSYGVFLNHVIFIWMLPPPQDLGRSGRFLLVTLLATAAAALSFYAVERPILQFRKRLRYGKRANPLPATAEPIVLKA